MHRLTDLDQACRTAGLTLELFAGWETRGRGGDGGYYRQGRPTAIMVHHTASNTSPINDATYMTVNSSIAPIANLMVDRGGVVWVLAAGPTNTNGTGGPLGTVPQNQMNTHAIGVEICNTGTGEPYPDAQQEAVAALVAALAVWYGIPEHQVFAHFEWAPTRKIDPYGPSRWNHNRNDYWNMHRFREDIKQRMKEADMGYPTGYVIAKHRDKPEVFLVGPGGAVHLDAAQRDLHLANLVLDQRNVDANDATYESWCRQAGVTP